MVIWVALPLAILLLVGFVYWTVVVTEGAYLGPRVVAFLYDWGARTYDQIKDFDARDEAWFLAQPLARALDGVPHPLILDVATGTGRLPLALLRHLDFAGHIVALDISRGMLHQAARKTAGYRGRVTLMWKDAASLPFVDSAFEAVTCLEALEFLPQPLEALREMVRVLKPGGVFLLTNRVGWEARLMPGRAYEPKCLEEMLRGLSLRSVETRTWQEYYDLIWARKGGVLIAPNRPRGLMDVLRCPCCQAQELSAGEGSLTCLRCGQLYLRQEGIICLEP
ncbi:MAG: methyltransferase domain-containing protein [Anaerolineae bacterium]